VKTVVRGLPTKLPHASIYLDELFEIEETISREYSKLSDPPMVSFEYEVDGNLKMTTHEDLESYGGRASRFKLNIVSENRIFSDLSVLSFYDLLAPTFVAPYALGESKWAVFGKVEQVFKERKTRAKQVADLVSPWSGWAALPVVLALMALILYDPPHRPVWLTLDVLAALLSAAIVAISSLGLKRNWIYFSYRRTDERARAAIRRERLEKLLWLLIGAAVGIAGTIISERFKH
jgi:hypothetical protein